MIKWACLAFNWDAMKDMDFADIIKECASIKAHKIKIWNLLKRFLLKLYSLFKQSVSVYLKNWFIQSF